MNKDRLAAAIRALPHASPSLGFDARLFSQLRARRLLRRAGGLILSWSCAGAAAMIAAPAWLGLSLPTGAGLKLQVASLLIEGVRWGSWAAQGLSTLDAPRLGAQLLAACLLAAAALKALAPRPSYGRTQP